MDWQRLCLKCSWDNGDSEHEALGLASAFSTTVRTKLPLGNTKGERTNHRKVADRLVASCRPSKLHGPPTAAAASSSRRGSSGQKRKTPPCVSSLTAASDTTRSG